MGLEIAKASGTTVNYYHADALGSTRLVTDSSKNVKILFSDSYQSYCQENRTPTSSEAYKFAGKPYSEATGSYEYCGNCYECGYYVHF